MDSQCGCVGEYLIKRRIKMTIHRCDLCGKEVAVWFSVTAKIDSTNKATNVYDLLKYQGNYDIYSKCFKSLIDERVE